MLKTSVLFILLNFVANHELAFMSISKVDIAHIIRMPDFYFCNRYSSICWYFISVLRKWIKKYNHEKIHFVSALEIEIHEHF